MSELRPIRPPLPKFPRLHRPDTVTLIVLAIVAIALALRLYDLGVRALHHDESLHATYSWYFSSNRFDPPYVHDPLMHGPFQFHFMALFFKLFGDGDLMARMPAALTGTVLVLTPLLVRRWLGPVGTVLAAVFLAFSPSLLYYSRFAREDIYIALWTVLLYMAAWRYMHDGKERWLAVAAAALALSFATKESVYLSVAILLLYLNIQTTLDLLDQRGTKGQERWIEGVFLAPIAWIVVALWAPLQSWRQSRGFTTFPHAGELVIVIGVLTLPQLSAAVQIPLTAFGVHVAGDTERQVGIITVCSLLGAATIVGLLWDWRRWLVVAAIFYAITIPLFTTEFLNTRDGISSDFWGSLDYWLAQQEVARGTQPWFYYVMMVPIYEFLTLIPALIGGIWLLVKRRDGLAALFAWWFIGSFAAFSYAGEKMPWLVIHLAVPLAFMAAYVLGLAVPKAIERLRDVRESSSLAWAGGAMAAFAMLLIFAVSVRTGQRVTFQFSDTPLEPLIYTQTSRAVPEISREIYDLQEQSPDLTVMVDSSEGMAWPWAWYLRHVNGVSYSDPAFIAANAKPGTVVLGLPSTVAALPAEVRDQAAEVRRYRHRWWFPEDGYRATTWSNFFTRLANGRLVEQWYEFTNNRISEESLGALDAEVVLPSPDTAARP